MSSPSLSSNHTAATYSADLRADLHCHSTASDGQFSPQEMVAHAAQFGVEVMALTDHDTTAGLEAAAATARAHALPFVPGIEISVTWQSRTLHIVGLNIDPNSPSLRHGLTDLQTRRQERAVQIAARLEKIGVVDALNRAEELANGGQLTRTHFARLLVQDEVVADMKQAFKRHLGAGKPANVKIVWADLADAITWIHEAGGLAVFAHPLRYGFTSAWRQRALADFKSAGGDALEVSSGASQQAQDLMTCTQDALRYDLLASAGSDFHSPEQTWLRYGRLAPLSSQLTPVWTRIPQLS